MTDLLDLSCFSSFSLHDVVDPVACCDCECCHASPGHGVVLLVEVSVMVRAHCSVLVDALSLCVSLDNWLRILCMTVEHGRFQTVAEMVKTEL